MASLKEVQSRIKSVISTQQITKAMKMVAASKLRKAQDQIIQMRPFVEKFREILNNVSTEQDDPQDNVYSQEREIGSVLIVPISSDKGLCGAFNSNIFKQTVALIQSEHSMLFQNGRVSIMPIGRRSYDYFRKRDFQVIDDHWSIFTGLSFDLVRPAAEFAMESFKNEQFDRVVLIYNEFKNVATQILRVEQLLPIVHKEDNKKADAANSDYIFEPDRKFITEELIPKSLKIQFFKAVLESNASEHGARMTAMDKATENAGELLRDLRLMYNRTRQAAITKEILEIVAGAEALKE